MNLEDEIRAALARREPPPDFTSRVLARVAAQPVRRPRPWRRWGAAIAACAVLAVGTAEYRHYRGEQAKAKVMLAVKIAGAKLNKAHRKVLMLNAAHRSNS